MEFTKEQQKVIDVRGTNALVSAAAGSGKTAVVVERLIERVIKDGIDIDEILLVTFTKAAAAEMKDRIREAFEKKLEETDPKDPVFGHVEKQFSLLFGAPISTIDSFCLDVIKNNFDIIEAEPSFRVADDGETAMIRADVMDELMERHYLTEDDTRFFDFLERFSVRRSDEDITDAIEKIHDFAVSRPDPEGFIISLTDLYDVKSTEEIKNSRLFSVAFELITSRLSAVRNAMAKAVEIVDLPDGPQTYRASFEEDLSLLDELLEADDFFALFGRASGASFSKLSSAKSPGEDKSLREAAKALRARAKKMFEKLQSSFFEGTLEDILAELKQGKEDMKVLSELSLEFLRDFREEKKRRGLMDFTDIEHSALRILQNAEVLRRYRKKFREVMVDEYQDCNRIQEEIFKCVSNGRNLFCVGDVKQSIYSFRDACPDLFVNKYQKYAEEEEGELILLSKNFRSRQAVLDATNVVFKNIMHSDVGGVEYDKNAFLNYSDSYTTHNPDDMTEYLLAPGDRDSDLSGMEIQALSVAKRIRELVGNFDVEDRKTKTVRKCTYGDIVILMRSLSEYGQTYAGILSDSGIPVSLDNKTGYLLSAEIRTLINFLYVIDNPRQDIPLAGTLLSIFGDFDESDLALIRAGAPKATLFEAVERAAGEGDEKASLFLAKLERYRHAASYLSMYELLTLIIKEHGYDNIVRAGKNGALGINNLNMLLFRASEFEKTSYKGLFRFIRYIEYLKRYEIDMKGPSEEDPDRDAVRIMTVHHSKGLEFPVVMVCELQRRFNSRDLSERLLTDDVLGAGTDIIDIKRRTRKKTFVKKLIQLRKENALKGEELRILYVAMTRAEQKLILSSVEAQDGFGNGTRRTDARILSSVTDADCFGHLLDLAFDMDPETAKHIKKKCGSVDELVMEAVERAADEDFLKKDFILKAEAFEGDEDEEIKRQIHTVFYHDDAVSIPEKLSVSYIKHEAMEEAGAKIAAIETERYRPVPAFISGKAERADTPNTGALRGTAYHAFFEHLDFERMSEEEDVRKQIDELQSRGILDEKEAGFINVSDITAFARTDLAARMKRAAQNGCLFREQPFVILVKADEIDPSYPGDEKIMVQGIIDAYFIEDGKAVIMDYKTDRAEIAEELILKYRAQLDYYAKAIRQLTGMEISGEIIYSVALKEEIVVS